MGAFVTTFVVKIVIKMASYSFIQGASRGLGLQFCRSLLNVSPEARVIASCRKPDAATELSKLQSMSNGRLRVIKCDVSQEQDIERAKETTKDMLPDGEGLDLVVNCAGVIHPSGKGETILKQVTKDDLSQVLDVNVTGPVLVAKHFAPLLQRGGPSAFGTKDEWDRRGEMHSGGLVSISARVGSINENTLGGLYSYRISKSALNSATKSIAMELARHKKNKVLAIALHPGTVDTDLIHPFINSISKTEVVLKPEESVEKMLSLIDRLTLQDAGSFICYDGSKISW